MSSILCIDDEVEITSTLSKVLSHYGNEVHTSNSAAEGVLLAATTRGLDLIILDVNLDDSNGLNICEVLKNNAVTKSIPVIFLSAHATVEERVKGLRRGACDYIAKPFDIEELVERINIAVGKNTSSSLPHELKLNREDLSVFDKGEEIKFTQKEFDIFEFLLSQKSHTVSKYDIQKEVWSNIAVGSRTVDTHIINIKKKIFGTSFSIKNKFGKGYVLEHSY